MTIVCILYSPVIITIISEVGKEAMMKYLRNRKK